VRIGATVVALLVACAARDNAQQLPAHPGHIVLIRHGEEPSDADDPHLSKEGRARADAFVEFMTHDPAMIHLGTPAAIFATETTKDDNGQRTQETVTPLARALRLPVLAQYHSKDYDKLATRVLSDPSLTGKTVVVCWNHEWLPQLAVALGVNPEPPKWKGKVYDLVYVITYKDRHVVLTTMRYGGS
jgi:phosphohistidine phosphatase SixA